MTQAVLTRRLPFAEQHLIDYLIVSGEVCPVARTWSEERSLCCPCKGIRLVYPNAYGKHRQSNGSWNTTVLIRKLTWLHLGKCSVIPIRRSFLKAIVVDFLYHDMNDMRVDEADGTKQWVHCPHADLIPGRETTAPAGNKTRVQ